MRVPGSIVVANGKGGVGKTSMSANLAALSAQSGVGTVAVDLDPQGNLSSDLGVDHDGGKSLLAAALDAGPLELWPTGREGLELVGGGEDTAHLGQLGLLQGQGDAKVLAGMLHRALSPLGEAGRRLWIDTPTAAGSALADAALMTGEWLLIPTKGDRGSLSGLVTMLRRMFTLAEGLDSAIKPAGVVLFGADLRAKRLNAEVREELTAALDGLVPVCETVVRYAEKASRDARAGSLTAGEYAEQAEGAPKWHEALRQEGGGYHLRVATNAQALAADYEALAAEIDETVAAG